MCADLSRLTRPVLAGPVLPSNNLLGVSSLQLAGVAVSAPQSEDADGLKELTATEAGAQRPGVRCLQWRGRQ